MKNAITILSFLLLTAVLAVCGCANGEGDAAGADSTTAAADSAKVEKPRKEKAIKVDQAPVHRGDLVQSVFADGVVRTPRAVEIKAKVTGEYLKVLVRDGDVVRKNQVLARIDPREYALALEEARYRHMQALSQIAAEGDDISGNPEVEKNFAVDKAALDKMLARGEVTRAEYQDRLLTMELKAINAGAFRQDVFAQRTGLAEARVAEERARLNLEYTDIRAPSAGVVCDLQIVAGEQAAAGQIVCSIYDNSRLEAVVNVLEADLVDLHQGRPVLLAVPAVEETLQARVDVVSPRLDEASRTCEVLVRFDNPEQRFRPGMFVRAEIAARVHHDKLMVPRNAVLSRDNRTLVFKVIPENRAQWLYVDTGLENGDWIEILKVHSGGSLAPDDQVVVSNHLTLAHEAKLKIGKTMPPADRWSGMFAAAESNR